MGFFKDVRALQKQADAMRPERHKGMLGGFRAMGDAVATANTVMGDLAGQQQLAQRLMTVGRVGTATVTAISDTGMTVNDNPSVRLELLVTVDGGEPYPVEHQQVISRIAIASFQPGATVPVRVDPDDPNVLIIA